MDYGTAITKGWPSFSVPPCTFSTGRYLGTKRTVVVPFTAHLAPSDSDAPNCNYVINGTFKAITISSTRVVWEESNDPELKAKCFGTDQLPPSPPPPPDPPPPPRPDQITREDGPEEDDGDDDDGVNIGAVVGGVVGGVAVVLAFVVALVYVNKGKPVLAIRKHAAQTPQATTVSLPAVGVPLFLCLLLASRCAQQTTKETVIAAGLQSECESFSTKQLAAAVRFVTLAEEKINTYQVLSRLKGGAGPRPAGNGGCGSGAQS